MSCCVTNADEYSTGCPVPSRHFSPCSWFTCTWLISIIRSCVSTSGRINQCRGPQKNYGRGPLNIKIFLKFGKYVLHLKCLTAICLNIIYAGVPKYDVFLHVHKIYLAYKLDDFLFRDILHNLWCICIFKMYFYFFKTI